MEQLVFVPASVYNSTNLNIQSFTKQELPKYQAEQNYTYHFDSLKKEINKTLFAKTDSSVDKYLSCLRLKFPKSYNLKMDGVETGLLLSDSAQQLNRQNADVPVGYFTLLDAVGVSPNLVLNQDAKTKESGSWVPFKI